MAEATTTAPPGSTSAAPSAASTASVFAVE